MDIEQFVTVKDSEEILRKLIKVNTTNPTGNEMDLVKVILSLFPQDNLDYEIIDHGNNRGSLMIKVAGADSSKSLAFVGHIDTVPVSKESDWEYPPLAGKVEDGYMYGRGTADMKGGVTAMILTALYFIKTGTQPAIDLKFCFTADEEVDGMGVVALKEAGYLDDTVEIFICEPSAEKLGLAEKGALWLEISATGKAAHASMPDCGVNAIDYLQDYIRQFKKQVDLKSKDPLLGQTTMTVTTMQGGVKTNIIPVEANATLDIRTIVGCSHDQLLATADKLAKQMMREEDGLSLEVKVKNNRPAVGTDKDEAMVKNLQAVVTDLDYTNQLKGLYFYTDASQLIPDLQVPFVILGPGADAMAHQKNERIELASIVRVTKIYLNYITNY
ncbi:MAG: M20 family metallopeptidase [Bacillota bacterium]